MALGNSSTTCPRISRSSSLAIYPLWVVAESGGGALTRRRRNWKEARSPPRSRHPGSATASVRRIVLGEKALDAVEEVAPVLDLAEAVPFLRVADVFVGQARR